MSTRASLTGWLATLLITACAAPRRDTAPAPPPPATAPSLDLAHLRERLAPLASCATDDSVELWRRVWCQGARLGTEPLPEPPPSPTLTPFVGLTFSLPADGDLEPVIAKSVPLLAVLVLSATHGRVVRVFPENEKDERDLDELLIAAVTLLSGAAGRQEERLHLPDSMRHLVADLIARPAAALTWGAEHATFGGATPAQLFVVRGLDRNDALIVVEPLKSGAFVSLFPLLTVDI